MMEPQEYCYDNRECCCKDYKKRNCLVIVTVIIVTVFAFSLGLLIGAIASVAILVALPAIIVFIVTMAILLVISIILLVCCNKKCKEKNKCY